MQEVDYYNQKEYTMEAINTASSTSSLYSQKNRSILNAIETFFDLK